MRLTVLFVVLFAGVLPVRGQGADLSFFLTRAEATDFRETSRYDEVMAFVDVLAASSDQVHLTTFGYTTEGRALPLVVFGDVADASPEAVRASGKTRVFVQANIHAGEVCGKEAMLMLLRALAGGQHAAWADSLVLLVAPIYNADGNERVSLYNRPRQHGPIGGMGQRPNAQGLDLNRDHMKLDSPEARSLARLLTDYDPHLTADLHTTNGTVHAYHVTYAPPLHPNTPAAITRLLRDDLLPTVTERIRETYGWHYYYYGNLPWPGMDAERGWYTFDHRPRFNTHYVGLRNRPSILSEAYSYATFEERVLATLYFVEEILDYTHAHAAEIRALTEAADAASVVGQDLALRADFARSAAPVEILLGEVASEKHPSSGETMLRRLDAVHPEAMPEYGTFAATETTTAPAYYYVPAAEETIIDRLGAHGIRYETLTADETRTVERFRIDSVQVASREFQGHHEHTYHGTYETADVTLPAGTVVVDVAQPLGRLAFTLLEPRSDDGLAAWGMVEAEGVYPVMRGR